MGTLHFYGLELDSTAKLMDAPAVPTRRLEFIGDSITCGYGTLGHNPFDHTDNYQSYGAMIARELGASIHVAAWSGKGVVINSDTPMGEIAKEPLPLYYGRTIAKNEKTSWNFTQYIPDAIIINLGTNDYFQVLNMPEYSKVFSDHYIDFVKSVRSRYAPHTPKIFIVAGPMVPYPVYFEEIQAIAQATGSIYIHLPVLEGSDLGFKYHPSASGQAKMASIALDIIRKEMSW
eukprot:gene14601-17265_t